jgi:hypothetical protein
VINAFGFAFKTGCDNGLAEATLDLVLGEQGDDDLVDGEEGAARSCRRGEEAAPCRREKSHPAADLPVIDVPTIDLPAVDLPAVELPTVDPPTVDFPAAVAASTPRPAAAPLCQVERQERRGDEGQRAAGVARTGGRWGAVAALGW